MTNSSICRIVRHCWRDALCDMRNGESDDLVVWTSQSLIPYNESTNFIVG